MWDILKYRIQVLQSYTKVSNVPKDYMMIRHGDIIDSIRNYDKEACIQAFNEHINTSSIYADFPKESEIRY